MANLHFEKDAWRRGFLRVGGIDEVGRGAFAGPIVGACVCFPNNLAIEQYSNGVLIDDSKKLTHNQRLLADKWIRKNALVWGIGEVSSKIIDNFGVGKASVMAFRKAILSANRKINPLTSNIQFLLIDAFYVPFVKGIRKKNQLPIIHGDSRSLSIASASIIAKVYRDRLMTKLSQNPLLKKYSWDKNKGYGTQLHRDVIGKFGITIHHRRSFLNGFKLMGES